MNISSPLFLSLKQSIMIIGKMAGIVSPAEKLMLAEFEAQRGVGGREVANDVAGS